MNIRSLFAVMALAFVLGGCSTAKVDPNDDSVSLVYGYFDMKDAPSNLEWVSLKQYGGKKNKDGDYWGTSVKDGLFFHVGLPTGSYQVSGFGGTGGIPLLTRRPFEYDYGSLGRNGTAVRIQKPGLYFLGSHKYVEQKRGKFDMKSTKQPTEKELLQRLLKELQTDKYSMYMRQIGMVKQRLSEL